MVDCQPRSSSRTRISEENGRPAHKELRKAKIRWGAPDRNSNQPVRSAFTRWARHRGLPISDIMSSRVPHIPSDESMWHFLRRALGRAGHRENCCLPCVLMRLQAPCRERPALGCVAHRGGHVARGSRSDRAVCAGHSGVGGCVSGAVDACARGCVRRIGSHCSRGIDDAPAVVARRTK